MWIATGRTTSEIANELFVSSETIKSHTRHILQKLEAKNRANAVFIAIDLGWLTTNSEANQSNHSLHSLYE